MARKEPRKRGTDSDCHLPGEIILILFHGPVTLPLASPPHIAFIMHIRSHDKAGYIQGNSSRQNVHEVVPVPPPWSSKDIRINVEVNWEKNRRALLRQELLALYWYTAENGYITTFK